LILTAPAEYGLGRDIVDRHDRWIHRA
jgi:hypothetical protein